MAIDATDGPEIPAQTPPKTAALTAGQVVAAAGMAVGAVLLVAAIFQNATPSDFLDPITKFISSAVGGGVPAPGHILADGLSKAVVGAAALVAGYVGYTQLGEHKKAVQDSALPASPDNRWEDRYMAEQIAVKQAMVAARNQVYFGAAAQQAPARG